jgi:antitoxin CcdA
MPTQKKPAISTVNADVLCAAKALAINLSQACESHFSEWVKTTKRENWPTENRVAIGAYIRLVDDNGLFSEGWRSY